MDFIVALDGVVHVCPSRLEVTGVLRIYELATIGIAIVVHFMSEPQPDGDALTGECGFEEARDRSAQARGYARRSNQKKAFASATLRNGHIL